MALNSEKALANVGLQVNGVTVGYLPNTLTITAGNGNRTLRSLTGGGNSLKHVYSEDITTKVSKVTFQLPATAFDIQNIRNWQNNGFNNVIVLSDQSTNFSLTVQKATLINDPDISFSQDSSITVEFQGTPAS